jgi:hypothetical protein
LVSAKASGMEVPKGNDVPAHPQAPTLSATILF